jgi:hypothetical protein
MVETTGAENPASELTLCADRSSGDSLRGLIALLLDGHVGVSSPATLPNSTLPAGDTKAGPRNTGRPTQRTHKLAPTSGFFSHRRRQAQHTALGGRGWRLKASKSPFPSLTHRVTHASPGGTHLSARQPGTRAGMGQGMDQHSISGQTNHKQSRHKQHIISYKQALRGFWCVFIRSASRLNLNTASTAARGRPP